MLVSTSDLRAWTGIPDGDTKPNAKYETLSLAIQSFVENYTNRILEGTYYNNHKDYSIYDGNGESWIYAKQYPLSWVNAVYVDADRVWGSGTLVASADIVIDWQSGLIKSEAGYFTRGMRNVRIDYIAGFGASAVSSYPTPYDLKQVIIEMAVQSFKEGITGVHSVIGTEETKFIQMLSKNSMWRTTLNKYKNFAKRLEC